jgi:Bacterial SH3 domain
VKETAEPLVAPAPVAATAAPAMAPAGAVAMVLRMQQGHGNAHVARMLGQRRALARAPIRAGAGTGELADVASAHIYAQPDVSSPVVGELQQGQKVDLTSDEGAFYGVVLGTTKGYVKSGELFTAIDQIPAAKEDEFAQRAAAAAAAMDQAGHTAGHALRGRGTAPTGTGGALPDWFRDLQFKLEMVTSWGKEEDDAQQVLDDYATFYMNAWHGDLPPSLKILFQYAGRSSINQKSASSGGFANVGKFGGGLNKEGKPNPNWCTQTSTTAIIAALRDMGYAPVDPSKIDAFINNIALQRVGGQPNTVRAPEAITAKLNPGDMVMYLFDGCQYGGHTVTVVDDLGDSFLHVSGNTGDAIAVGMGEAQRLKGDPKSKAGNETFKLGECLKVATAEEQTASTAYIAKWDFGGKVLTYTVVRDSAFFAEIETIPGLPQAEQDKLLAKYKLRRLTTST